MPVALVGIPAPLKIVFTTVVTARPAALRIVFGAAMAGGVVARVAAIAIATSALLCFMGNLFSLEGKISVNLRKSGANKGFLTAAPPK
jgi:hypothetical protein